MLLSTLSSWLSRISKVSGSTAFPGSSFNAWPTSQWIYFLPCTTWESALFQIKTHCLTLLPSTPIKSLALGFLITSASTLEVNSYLKVWYFASNSKLAVTFLNMFSAVSGCYLGDYIVISIAIPDKTPAHFCWTKVIYKKQATLSSRVFESPARWDYRRQEVRKQKKFSCNDVINTVSIGLWW